MAICIVFFAMCWRMEWTVAFPSLMASKISSSQQVLEAGHGTLDAFSHFQAGRLSAAPLPLISGPKLGHGLDLLLESTRNNKDNFRKAKKD